MVNGDLFYRGIHFGTKIVTRRQKNANLTNTGITTESETFNLY